MVAPTAPTATTATTATTAAFPCLCARRRSAQGLVRASGAGLEGAVADVGDVVEEGDGQEGDDGERHYGDHWSASFPPGAAVAVRGPAELVALVKALSTSADPSFSASSW